MCFVVFKVVLLLLEEVENPFFVDTLLTFGVDETFVDRVAVAVGLVATLLLAVFFANVFGAAAFIFNP